MKYLITICIFLYSIAAQAQEVEMADQMRADGKIYVVVAVLAAILIGLIIYLVTIDKKVSNLEKKLKQ